MTQTHESKKDDLKATLDELVKATQRMLKDEWDKVKKESKKGDLKDEDSSFDITLDWIDSKIKKCFQTKKTKPKTEQSV